MDNILEDSAEMDIKHHVSPGTGLNGGARFSSTNANTRKLHRRLGSGHALGQVTLHNTCASISSMFSTKLYDEKFCQIIL